MYVRVKKIGSKRYAYLAEGISIRGHVRQKTLAYLGPISRVVSGIPSETREKVNRRIPDVDWSKIASAIRAIPLTLEELEDVKQSQFSRAFRMRLNDRRSLGRRSIPRAEGELFALALLARKGFNETFQIIGERRYRMK